SGGAAATSTIGTITPLLRATSPAVSIVSAAALVLVVKTTCDVTAAPASRCAATTDVISTATAQAIPDTRTRMVIALPERGSSASLGPSDPVPRRRRAGEPDHRRQPARIQAGTDGAARRPRVRRSGRDPRRT